MSDNTNTTGLPFGGLQFKGPNPTPLDNRHERTAILIGADAVKKLQQSSVAIFGVGGVGGACAEALARMGVGAIELYDNDKVTLSNLNRQVVALHSTVGKYKVHVMAERIADINPDCRVAGHTFYYMPDTAVLVPLDKYDYIIDAIDTVAAKVELAVRAKMAGVRIISAMGAGGKLDPMKFLVSDISKTETDPLARAVRKGLKERGLTKLKVVWSTEPPRNNLAGHIAPEGHRPPIGTTSCVPPACGLLLATEVIKDLTR